MKETPKWYGAHLEEYAKTAYIKDRAEYDRLYKHSIENPDEFWAEQAEKYLSWEKKWDFVQKSNFKEGEIEWFSGGVLNAAYNCLDRHMDALKDKIAYYWEGDDPSERKVVTYSDLFTEVNQAAALLKSKGVK